MEKEIETKGTNERKAIFRLVNSTLKNNTVKFGSSHTVKIYHGIHGYILEEQLVKVSMKSD